LRSRYKSLDGRTFYELPLLYAGNDFESAGF
jgi:hypothetical protein